MSIGCWNGIHWYSKDGKRISKQMSHKWINLSAELRQIYASCGQAYQVSSLVILYIDLIESALEELK